MSYSFQAKGATKEAALKDVSDKFDKVVEQQPVHAADKGAAMLASAGVVDLVGEPAEGEEIRVNVSGSLQWTGPDEDRRFLGASVSVGVNVGKPLA